MRTKKIDLLSLLFQGIVICPKSGDSVLKASEIMIRNAVSQLPVHDGNKVVGTITEQGIVRNLQSNLANAKVRNTMGARWLKSRKTQALKPYAQCWKRAQVYWSREAERPW